MKRDREQPRAIKSWATANGHRVAELGRISPPMIDAYDAVHGLDVIATGCPPTCELKGRAVGDSETQPL